MWPNQGTWMCKWETTTFIQEQGRYKLTHSGNIVSHCSDRCTQVSRKNDTGYNRRIHALKREELVHMKLEGTMEELLAQGNNQKHITMEHGKPVIYGMTLDFLEKGKVQCKMNEHVQNMLGEAPNDFDAMSVTQTFSPLTLLLQSCFMPVIYGMTLDFLEKGKVQCN
jgi:hypothetical protein